MPGAKQVFRGPGLTDELALRAERRPGDVEPLLEPVMRAGRRLQLPQSPVAEVVLARRRFRSDLDQLPGSVRTIRRPGRLLPRSSEQLLRLTGELRQTLQTGTALADS
jgi:nicotinate phosphoribosyltransferase